MNIYEKMQKAKELILEANLKKSGKNKFAGYTYYELADLLPTIIKVCNELKLFTQVNFTNEFAFLYVINVEEPSETLTFTSPMKDLQLKGANAVQALGGVETYQRRYLYMSAFDIIENDMFDSRPPVDEAPEKNEVKVDDKPATEETLSKMNAVIEQYAKKINKESSVLKKTFISKIGAKDAKPLTEAQAKSIIIRIEKQLNR